MGFLEDQFKIMDKIDDNDEPRRYKFSKDDARGNV